ncbi:SIS domain-containing protein [Pediococcus pentosaceus]|uniref:MurR/RpiR family transcriptional regulator n=1 Tax=Pediococcus pentosaceus TaxID=1255 RepID=UPI00132645CB|nr:MurR/RpiR family transcriptional regulator [Pediococcus pentosaceus]KAF0393445.1 SIS domain-containing protein [Pediococcus pentosaceus]KAF0433713.1 SIS domain-containing protein [Pediococcus pentosaceus]KAF0441960.1 SIS domain-containing protein [Pediococcus pentosaceus]MBF7108374.1 MurR/RpiR family transcriptional regulator [Pediococcus pentosaceus]
MNIIDVVEQKYPSLSRQERKIALKVIQHPADVKKMNINTLSKKAEVSTATVTRFVKKMGYPDFSQFKLGLAEATSNITENVDNAPLPDQVTDFYNQMITGTWKRINQKTLNQVAMLIKNAPRVFIFGLGSSGYNAQELSQRLMRMGINAFAPSDSHTMYISSSIMQKDDLLIVLSVSGKSNEVNEAVAVAKQHQLKIVSITAFDDSPLAEMSDYQLSVQYSEFVDNTQFINSQLGVVYIIDILSTMLLQNKTYKAHYQQTVAAILNRKMK